MPLQFQYRSKYYRWYSGLKREKKREMIRIFTQLKQQGIFLGFQHLQEKLLLQQSFLEKERLKTRNREEMISNFEYQALKAFLAILDKKSPLWNPYHSKFPYISLNPQNLNNHSQGLTSDIDYIEVFQWDERSGPTRLGNYPSNKKTPLKDMMQIYANHIAEKEAGFLAVSNPERTLMSYYAGPASRLFLIAQITGVQDVVQYELIMETIMNKISNLVPTGEDAQVDRIQPKLEGFFHDFSPKESVSIADALKDIANHKILRLICNKLQQEGFMTIEAMKEWLKMPIQKGLIDIEKDLNILYELGILGRRFIGDRLYIGLLRDITPVFFPPFQFLNNLPKLSVIPQISTEYLKMIAQLVEGRMNNTENFNTANNLLAKPDILKLLGYLQANYLQADHYSHLSALGIENPKQAVQELIEANFFITIENQTGKYYLPIIEIGFLVFSPEYLYSPLFDKITQDTTIHQQIYGFLCMLNEENPFLPLK
jgi:hypothetical protein